MKNLISQSQISTDPIQSMELVDLNLNPDTADCTWIVGVKDYSGNDIPKNLRSYRFYPEWSADRDFSSDLEFTENIPAWSLDRLIRLLPYRLLGGKDPNNKRNYDLILSFREPAIAYMDKDHPGDDESIVAFFAGGATIYDDIINCIKWLISKGFINSKYLIKE